MEDPWLDVPNIVHRRGAANWRERKSNERKKERRANPVDHDAETLIAEYRGLNLPGDVEEEATEEDEEEEAEAPAAR